VWFRLLEMPQAPLLLYHLFLWLGRQPLGKPASHFQYNNTGA